MRREVLLGIVFCGVWDHAMFRCYRLLLPTEPMLVQSPPHHSFTQSKDQAHGSPEREKWGHSQKKVDFCWLMPPTSQPGAWPPALASDIFLCLFKKKTEGAMMEGSITFPVSEIKWKGALSHISFRLLSTWFYPKYVKVNASCIYFLNFTNVLFNLICYHTNK